MRGKIGKISKTVQVYSNDPKRPQITLTLTMKVNDVLHAKKHNASEIFKNPCAKCHIDEGKGKKGLALFNADCIMCHNYNKSASPLNVLRDMPDDKLRRAIEDGIKGTSMPGWINSQNGPLTSEEISSLIEFIKGYK